MSTEHPPKSWQDQVKRPFDELGKAVVVFCEQNLPETYNQYIRELHSNEAKKAAGLNQHHNIFLNKKMDPDNGEGLVELHEDTIEKKKWRSDPKLARAHTEASIPSRLSFPQATGETYEDFIALLVFVLNDAAKQCYARAMSFEHDAEQIRNRPTHNKEEIEKLQIKAAQYYGESQFLKKCCNRWKRIASSLELVVERPNLPRERKELIIRNIQDIPKAVDHTVAGLVLYSDRLNRYLKKTKDEKSKAFMEKRLKDYATIGEAAVDMLSHCAPIIDMAKSIESTYMNTR